jgi:hypothetical protein
MPKLCPITLSVIEIIREQNSNRAPDARINCEFPRYD